MTETRPKPFVFVLMPFLPDFDDVYTMAIKPACEAAGAYSERVDEQIFQGSILLRIYNQIDKADVILADLSGRNPNVFYETGYAHALGKVTVLLTQHTEDIPFDLQHFQHIVYGGKLSTLRDELERRIRWCIENPKHIGSEPSGFEFYIRGIDIKTEATIHIPIPDGEYDSYSYVGVDIHNPTDRICEVYGSLALVFPNVLEPVLNPGSFTFLPDGRCLVPLGNLPTLLPSEWHQVFVDLIIEKMERTLRDVRQECLLRVFTELGNLDFKFGIVFVSNTSNE